MSAFVPVIVTFTGLGLTVTGAWRRDAAMVEVGLVLVFAATGIVRIIGSHGAAEKKM